jgi:hypothetical protein
MFSLRKEITSSASWLTLSESWLKSEIIRHYILRRNRRQPITSGRHRIN